MSLRAMLSVFDNSDSKGMTRLVLLALADHAHDDGSHAYPAVPTIARKARCDERTVQRALRALERECELVATGRSRNGTTIYHLTTTTPLALETGLGALRGGDILTPEVEGSLTVKGSGGNLPPEGDALDATPPVTTTRREDPDPGLPLDVQRWIGQHARRFDLDTAREVFRTNFHLDGVRLELAVAYLAQRRRRDTA